VAKQYFYGMQIGVCIQQVCGKRMPASSAGAFIITRAKLLFDKVEVADNVILGDLDRILLVVVRKDEPHLSGVITDGSRGIILGRQVF